MAEQINDELLTQVRQMLADAIKAATGEVRENAAQFVEQMATPAAVAALEIRANPSDTVAVDVLDGIKVQAVQIAAAAGIALSPAVGEAALNAAVDVGVRIIARVIRG